MKTGNKLILGLITLFIIVLALSDFIVEEFLKGWFNPK